MYLNFCSYFLISVTTIQPIQPFVIIMCLMYRICIWFTFIEPFDHKPQPTMNLKFKSNLNEPQNHNKKLWPFSTLFLWNVEIQHTYNPYNNLFGDDKKGWGSAKPIITAYKLYDDAILTIWFDDCYIALYDANSKVKGCMKCASGTHKPFQCTYTYTFEADVSVHKMHSKAAPYLFGPPIWIECSYAPKCLSTNSHVPFALHPGIINVWFDKSWYIKRTRYEILI